MTKKSIIIVLVAIVAILAVYGTKQLRISDSTDQVMCTMEAKICPDSSAVGRSGPLCEFAACPGVKNPTPVPTTPTPTSSQSPASFGDAITLTLGKSVTFSDSLSITLKTINDSRCKNGVQCIWAGELSPVLSLSNGSFVVPRDLTLGTITAQTTDLNRYRFTLVSATESSATISVTLLAN